MLFEEYSENDETVKMENLLRKFKSHELDVAKACRDLFDLRQTGVLDRKLMIKATADYFLERQHLALTLSDTDSILKALGGFSNVLITGVMFLLMSVSVVASKLIALQGCSVQPGLIQRSGSVVWHVHTSTKLCI